MKNLNKWLAPVVPVALMLFFVAILEITSPGTVAAVWDRPGPLFSMSLYFGGGLVWLLQLVQDYALLFAERKAERVSVELRLNRGLYTELEQMAANFGMTSAEDVIPGVLRYVLDSLPDEEVRHND